MPRFQAILSGSVNAARPATSLTRSPIILQSAVRITPQVLSPVAKSCTLQVLLPAVHLTYESGAYVSREQTSAMSVTSLMMSYGKTERLSEDPERSEDYPQTPSQSRLQEDTACALTPAHAHVTSLGLSLDFCSDGVSGGGQLDGDEARFKVFRNESPFAAGYAAMAGIDMIA